MLLSVLAITITQLASSSQPCTPNRPSLRADGFEVVAVCTAIPEGLDVEVTIRRLRNEDTIGKGRRLTMTFNGHVEAIASPEGWQASGVDQTGRAEVRWTPAKGQHSVLIVNECGRCRMAFAALKIAVALQSVSDVLRHHASWAIVVVMACSKSAQAECVVPPPPCQAMDKAAIVFVGDVILAGALEEQTGAFRFMSQPVRFRVIERFKGIPEDQMEVAGSVRLTAEAILFAPGLRYIVYASRASDGTWVTACSRTATLKERPEEIRQLRLCKRK